MAKIEIGKKTYIVRELNFVAVKKAWSAIMQTMLELDPIQAIEAALTVIGAGLQEEPEFKPEDFGIVIDPNVPLEAYEIDAAVVAFLSKQMKASQISNIQRGLDEIIEEAGLRPEEGELRALGLIPSLGTEIQDQSSVSSLQPDAKEAVGTA